MYKPTSPFSVALLLYSPIYANISGVRKKTYPNTGETFFGSFKTYGGTETTVNGIYSIMDTADIETWYNPDIRSDCRVQVAGTDKVYEVVGEPENIEMRNQFMKLKVRRVKGGA